jgi:hypothetical protein
VASATGDIEALDHMMPGRALTSGPTRNLEIHRRSIELFRRAFFLPVKRTLAKALPLAA